MGLPGGSSQAGADPDGTAAKSAATKLVPGVAVAGVTSQAYSVHQEWVVLRSLATNTFVAVEPPPSDEAMKVHGKAESVSLHNIFGFLRGGFLWSKATNSLVNVCNGEGEVCTGFLEHESDPHWKRLQSPITTSQLQFETIRVAK